MIIHYFIILNEIIPKSRVFPDIESVIPTILAVSACCAFVSCLTLTYFGLCGSADNRIPSVYLCNRELKWGQIMGTNPQVFLLVD